jgi:diguanylate cyclase (GGDEF)-like protein/PAS domain S-box-containing protein
MGKNGHTAGKHNDARKPAARSARAAAPQAEEPAPAKNPAPRVVREGDPDWIPAGAAVDRRLGNRRSGGNRRNGSGDRRVSADRRSASGESLYLDSLEDAHEALFLADPAGLIRFWSAGAERLFGHSRGEIAGRPVASLLAGDIPEELKPGGGKPGAFPASAKAGKPGPSGRQVESLGLRKDGTCFPVRLSMGALQVGDQRLRFALARDITDEKRAELALRESEDANRTARQQLQYRLRFENLITSISTHFINLPSDRIDLGIRYALHALGEFAGVDRCYIFMFSPDRITVDNTHEWCSPGIDPQINRLKGLAVSRYPWFMERVNGLQTVNVPRVADLPPGAAAEKEEFRAEGIRSLIVVPMVHRGVPKGYLGFDSVREEKRWSDEIAGLLRIVGEIFVNALDRKKIDEALTEAKAKYKNIFENASEGIFQTSPQGRLLSVNPALARIFGYADAKEMESAGAEVGAGVYADPKRRDEFVRILEERSTVTDFESQARRKDGTVIWISENARAVRKPDGRLDYFEGTVVDITERKRMEEQLVRGALYDGLTGLPNRSLLHELIGRSLDRARRKSNHLFAAMIMDLDRFKMVNDSMGHAQGDRLLVAFARRLAAFLPPDATFGRLGGDEFCLLIEDIRDTAPATALADRILEALSLPFELEGREVYAGASIGIAIGNGQYQAAEEVLRDADTAMHRAKNAGKARYEVFDASMHAKAVHLLTLETDLRKAVERKEFRLHYQPIVSLEDGALTGFEALIRWKHPRLGMVSPMDFIPLAEDTGLIVPIGEWVLREACRQLADWRKMMAGGRKLTMSVNISGKQLDDLGFIGLIEGILLDSGLEASCLKLEVTESAIMGNPEMAATILEKLKRMGLHLSLDDFGTGYSSLSYLHRFPFHNLKIDRSFISKIEGGEKDEEIVRVINSLARNLGMSVVAEGIETQGQWDLLQKLECGYGQGYYFSKPLEEGAACDLISRNIVPTRPPPEPKAAKA